MAEPRRLPRWLWPVGLAGVLVGGGLLAAAPFAATGPSYKNFRIPSESMEPTLRTREQFIVRTSEFLPIKRGDVYLVRKRGDVFAYRVVGLPGEIIAVTGSKLSINNAVAEYSGQGVAGLSGTCSFGTATMRREFLPGGASHVIMGCSGNFGNDQQPIKIPASHYFLLGDNRGNAADSRYDGPDWGLGLVPEGDFVGKAERIFVSSDSARIGQEID